MTKQELELRVAELEKELVNLPKINEIKKREQELVQEAYDSKRKIQQLEKTIEEGTKKHTALSDRFNSLASLFDEYIKATDDIIQTNKLFLRNATRTQELMNIKITAFNGKGDESK
jgi:FtsZ-binding cell division protein ZapB